MSKATGTTSPFVLILCICCSTV